MKGVTNKFSRLSKILLIKCIILKINIKLKVLIFYNGVKKMSNTSMLSDFLRRDHTAYHTFRNEIIDLLFEDNDETIFTDDEIFKRIRILVATSKNYEDDTSEVEREAWLRWALDNIS